MTKKILGYVMARNSWPILGLSIVHALRAGCQHVIVVNHRSTDNTNNELEKFKRVWPGRLTVIMLDFEDFFQETTTKIILSGFGAHLYDWIYVFDSDEFLLIQSKQSLTDILQSIPENIDAVRYQIDQWIAPQDMNDLDVDQYIRIDQRALKCNFLQQPGEFLFKELIAGNINYFDIEFPSKVIVRGRFHNKISAGSHFIRSITDIKEKSLSSKIIRCAHLPLLSKRHLMKKALFGKAIINAGLPRWHAWQNQALYQLDLAGQLDDYWKRHSVPKSAQSTTSAGLPTLFEDKALASVLRDAINTFKKNTTDNKSDYLTENLTKSHELSIEGIISKVWLTDNERNNHIVNLTQVIQAKEQEIVNLTQITQAKEQEIVNLTQVTQAKEQEIVNLTQVTQAKDREINEILNCTCWKITLLIRIIGSFLRRITIFTKKVYEYFLLAKKEIKNKNIINIIKLVIKVFIKSGFNGLKQSLVKLKKKNNSIYYQWILDNEILTKDEERFLKNKILNFKYMPLVSIVMPVYNSDIGFLEQAINSVLKQSYNNWELCIADDFSSNKNVLLILKKFEKKDNRIKVVYRKSNGHISEASNSALKIAQGEWITFLDHDDILNEHALFYIVNSINDNPNIKLIYSDEDKILENTFLRSDPYFKTDWNKELFYGQNYILHMACYKKDIINVIGGFRVGFEGSQDYDLTLRYIEKIQDHEISHVPRILYHWRISDLSTSKNIQNKKYSVTNGIKALNEHLNRIGIEATTEIVHRQYYKINYSLPKDLPLVTIIIPTKNNYLYLKKCIDSILEKTTYLNYEILIINNNSTDENTLSYLSELILNYKIQVILDSTSEFNYSLINNNAVTKASGDLLCFMNNDTEVISDDWLTEMVSLALQKNVAFVGCKLLYADNTIQHAGVVLGIGGLAGHAFKYFPSTSPGYFYRALLTSEYSAVTAACTLVKKKIFLELKGFDPDNLKVSFNDVDICIKAIDKGYRNIFTPFALLYHYESKSRGYDVTPDQKKRFQNEFLYISKKWNKYIFSDKCYSPNLTLNSENFSYDKSRVPRII
jgi:glycosyltransferase involved in cell wall biosynthesis